MKTNWKKLLCLTLSLLMLLGSCVGCAPTEGEEEPPVPVETTPTPTPSTPSGGKNGKLEEMGTDVYFSEIGFENYCVTYVTYNGYHNPIEERSFSLENPTYAWVTSYEYNAHGKPTKIEAKAISYENYAAETEYYSVVFDKQGHSTVSFNGESDFLTAKVEYYDNGTIKSWAILLGESYVQVGVEQDQNGRRTKYWEAGETVSYSYATTTRMPSSVLYEDSFFSTPTITLAYTDGQLSGMEGIGGDRGEHFAVTLSHTADGKRPTQIVWRDYKMHSEGYEQHTYDMTYTDTGRYASLRDLRTTVSADYEFSDTDVYTFTYDADDRLTGRTKDIYDDPGAPDWKKSEVVTLAYDANGHLAGMVVKAFSGGGSLHWSEDIAYVYDANGRMKESSKMRIAYDLFEPDTILSKEKTVCEYDEHGYESKRTVYTYGNPDNWEEITETRVY